MCLVVVLIRCVPDTRHERSQGQANYLLIERRVVFDSVIPKVAGALRVLLRVQADC